jgi:hypothetical protein
LERVGREEPESMSERKLVFLSIMRVDVSPVAAEMSSEVGERTLRCGSEGL